MDRPQDNPLLVLVRRHLALLALCSPDGADVPLGGRTGAAATVVLLALHLAGLAAVWRALHEPLILAPLTLALALIVPLVARLRGRPFAVETLAPLGFVYLLVLARIVAVHVLGEAMPYQDEASPPQPELIAYQLDVALAMGLCYMLATQAAYYARGGWRARVLCAIAALPGLAGLLFYAVETVVHRSRGVTGSDPYAYVQMAVDLVTHGTPVHTFSLFPAVVNLGVRWYPILHTGYHLPMDVAGEAVTVWPVGGSLWLALCYAALGERGVTLATPIAGLASLLATGLLAWTYARRDPPIQRSLITAVTVLLLGTSWEQLDRSLVPLVDVQAQLFSVLAVWLALCAAGGRRVVALGALAGLALGMAYFVRHTQVLVAVAIVLATIPLGWRARAAFLAAAGAASLAVALPDLYYHHLYLGGWLVPESEELALFSADGLLDNLEWLYGQIFRANEFGYAMPFVVYGAWRAARDDPPRFAVLAAWMLLLVAFHLPYQALLLRDLLPEFPPLALLAALGMVAAAADLCRWARGVGWRRALAGVAIFAAAIAVGTRTWPTASRPPVATFGYLTATQRASFEAIGVATPPNAVIGSTLNDGPLDLYADRATFRPGSWSSDELYTFLRAMEEAGRPVYLLFDGSETSAAGSRIAGRYGLTPVGEFDVPNTDESDTEEVTLWQVRPSGS